MFESSFAWRRKTFGPFAAVSALQAFNDEEGVNRNLASPDDFGEASIEK
jgi:hypothetical protein